ncbi:tRNA-dihydrouridine(20a/20b) synthase [NAD(P)+]-like isoform X3 [Latimeria chalumnae]
MTLQWTAVATFLYVEIGLLLLLCLPFISPQRWQKVFRFQLWGKIASYWNKAFLTIIVVLIVLFLDAVREVRKYSAAQVVEKDKSLFPNVYDHIHMKLFRAQRNLYISGFSLFLWLSLRRVVTLLTHLATTAGASEALKIQAESANEAAKKYMEENEILKRPGAQGCEWQRIARWWLAWARHPGVAVSRRRGRGDLTVAGACGRGRSPPKGHVEEAMNWEKRIKNEDLIGDDSEQLTNEIEKLKLELKKSSEALSRSKNELLAVKKQSESLTREYDRLMREHEKLQKLVDEKHDKKGL